MVLLGQNRSVFFLRAEARENDMVKRIQEGLSGRSKLSLWYAPRDCLMTKMSTVFTRIKLRSSIVWHGPKQSSMAINRSSNMIKTVKRLA